MTATVAMSKHNCEKKMNLKKISKHKSSEDNKKNTFKENLLTTLFQNKLMIIIGITKYFSYSTRQVSLPIITRQMDSSLRREEYAWLNSSQYKRQVVE